MTPLILPRKLDQWKMNQLTTEYRVLVVCGARVGILTSPSVRNVSDSLAMKLALENGATSDS